jgi:hypothetical protein
MKPFSNASATRKVNEGKHYWVAIVAFAAGSTIKMDDGQDLNIRGNWVLKPPVIHGKINPWKSIEVTGTVELLIGENFEPPPPNAGELIVMVPTQALALRGVINVANPGPTALIAAGIATRALLIQNMGTSVVKIYGANTVLNADLVAVLSACAVANDGTGGSLELDGFSGALWGAGVTAASDCAVVAW